MPTSGQAVSLLFSLPAPKIIVHKIRKFSLATRVAFCCHSRYKCLSNSCSLPQHSLAPMLQPMIFGIVFTPGSACAFSQSFELGNTRKMCNMAWRNRVKRCSWPLPGQPAEKLYFNLHIVTRSQLHLLSIYTARVCVCVTVCAYQYVQVVTTVWMGLVAAHTLNSTRFTTLMACTTVNTLSSLIPS